MKLILICFAVTVYLNAHTQNLFNPGSTGFSKSYFKSPASTFSEKENFSKILSGKPPGNICYDSSFTKEFRLNNQSEDVYNTLHTYDNGILVCGEMYDTTKYSEYTHEDGFIMKMDDKGNILWIKKIIDSKQHSPDYIYVYTLKELQNHDVIAIAGLDTADGFHTSPIILKLDENGNLLWYKLLQTSLFSPGSNYDVEINNITEVPNGDLILCGTSTDYSFAGDQETIIRLNALGNLIWSDNFGNNKGFTAGANGVAAFVVNGNIVECGLSFGGTENSYVTGINFLTLDYVTGNLLDKKFCVPNYATVHKNQNKGLGHLGAVKCKLLNNGHYLVYGVVNQQIFLNVDSSDYFGVAEFDGSFNLVNSYLISSSNRTYIYADDIEVADNGKVYYSLYEDLLENGDDLFFISDNGNQISKSRKIHYSRDRNPGTFSQVTLFNDNSYGFTHSFSTNPNSAQDILEFKKLHDVDTISDCLGTDSLLTIHAPYNLKQDPDFKYLDNNIPNKIYNANHKISVVNFTDYYNTGKCTQQNNCDNIHIHGTANICGPDDEVYFTASRNKNCGAFAQWSIDTSVINSLRQVNDTTAGIRFKSVNWDGKLYATLAAPSCAISQPEDSIELHVTSQPVAKLSLGSDTIFCLNTTPLILHAGPDFNSYAWQNGSTDSTLAVTKTGKYFVTVADHCNNFQIDTINATEASDAFKIGNDTTKCNDDSILLKATPGFTNYSWQPNYKITNVSGNVVRVFPAIDTSYNASAEFAGCAVHDTVHIRVTRSPSINLGNDTSICYGTKLTLDAGGGFDHYLWNNGSQSRVVYADSVGFYSIAADINGCSSFDTINLISIKRLPFVNLGNDTTFCFGDEFTLTPEIQNADKYYWQNGSNSPTFIIRQPGEYAVTASNACGNYTDAVKISQSLCKLILPSAFTPNNDGLNDVFKAKYAFPVKSYRMVIYNRWGQQIFVSEDIAKGWDGNYRGVPVNQSTYIWIVTVTNLDNEKLSLHGTVTVIR